MASEIVLKQRIKSIRGTRQITKAMELVSASKLRRAQEYAIRSRDYRDLAYDLLKRLNAMDEVERTPLFRKRLQRQCSQAADCRAEARPDRQGQEPCHHYRQ